jgi:hypothetical protein
MPVSLDAVADELYGLRPEQFTAARSRRAAAARTAGDRGLAEQITALRRPSLSAWASNLLVHEQPDEVQPLLDLGTALRQAHSELDGEQLRELVRQQRMLIRALSRQAAQLAADAGHPLGQDAQREVQETLQAVLADPDAAERWAAGRLVKPLTPAVGFPAGTPKAPPRRGSPSASPAKPPPSRRREESAAQERRREESAAQERRREQSAAEKRQREQLAEARQAAEEADRDLRTHEAETEAAGRQAQEAKERLATLRERVTALADELSHAQEEFGQARGDERAARERVRKADRLLRDARSRADAATARRERLAADQES